MMDQDFLGKLRANVQASLSRDRVTASDMFKQIIARPPEPSPMEIWQDFISKPAQEHQAMAQQLGRDEFLKHSDDMLTLGEQLVGPSARNLMPYLEQFVPPPDIAGPEISGYSPLIDAALAEVENYGTEPGPLEEQIQP